MTLTRIGACTNSAIYLVSSAAKLGWAYRLRGLLQFKSCSTSIYCEPCSAFGVDAGFNSSFPSTAFYALGGIRSSVRSNYLFP